MFSAFQKKARGFLKARDGSAIVEFAFIAPVMITFMMGSVVAFDAARAVRQMSTTAATVSDLTTRIAAIDDDTSAAIFITADAILGHYKDGNTYNITITSVANPLSDGLDDTLRVVWSFAKNAGSELKDADLSSYDFPTIPNGESVILAEVEMQYNPIFVFRDFKPNFDFTDISIRRPRFVNEVCYEENATTTTCSDDLDAGGGGGGGGGDDDDDAA